MAAMHDGDEPASGEESAAEAKVCEWVESCWEVMKEAATVLLDDRDAAADVAQRAFMTALDRARSDPDEVNGIEKPCAWLVGITRRQAFGVLRTEARRRRLRRENGYEIRENLFPEPGPGSEEDLQAEWVLEAAPKVLTGRQLEVVLIALEGMTDEEITPELDVKRGTVRRHRTDAIRKLRKHVSQAAGDDTTP